MRAAELSDTEWHTYSYGFGPGFGKLLPANAASIWVGAILNSAGGVSGNRTYEVTNRQLKATDESARTTPQRVFWVETSGGITWTYTSSAWGDHYGSATGTANIGQGPFSWIFSLGGDWVDTANENIYYRIELTNESTGAVSYLPDADGHHRFLYVDNNRLEEFTMHGVSSVAPGAYTAQLQERIGDGGAYRWNGDAYGDMVFQIF